MKDADPNRFAALALKYGLPERQLTEAREALIFNGARPLNVDSDIEQLCRDANAQGGGVAMFDKLLKGQIAILRASQS